jgi:hypothetical protein
VLAIKSNVPYIIKHEGDGINRTRKREGKKMDKIIEYGYSSLLGKHTVRTKGIKLKGRGVKQHQEEEATGLYNCYSLTEKAFDAVCKEYKNIGMY